MAKKPSRKKRAAKGKTTRKRAQRRTKPARKTAAKARASASRKTAAKGRARPAPKSAAKPAARHTPPKRTAAAPKTNPVRELARRIVDLTIQENDTAAFDLYAIDIESAEPGMPPQVGLDAIKQKFTMWRGMVSESSWTARNVWVDGTTIIIEWSGRVRLSATGTEAVLDEIAIHETENGKIVRERFYYNPAALQPQQAASPQIGEQQLPLV